jgi:HEAT repeat protein
MQPDEAQKHLLADLTSGDEDRAEAAVAPLAELGPALLPTLEPLLASDVTDHRWWAVRVIGQMSDPPSERLIHALSDPSAEVRAAAALGLSTHPAEAAAPALAGLLKDEDSIVGILAVNALIAIGKPAVPVLLEAYPGLDQRGRIQCMRALADLRDHRAIRLMMTAIEEESAMLRFWAEQGLERLGLNMVYIKPE